MSRVRRTPVLQLTPGGSLLPVGDCGSTSAFICLYEGGTGLTRHSEGKSGRSKVGDGPGQSALRKLQTDHQMKARGPGRI